MKGKIFPTACNGRLIVLSPAEVISGDRLWNVLFPTTGGRTKARASNIRKGSVKDPKRRSVAGIGFMDGVKVVKNCRVHDLWCAMLRRCYNPKDTAYNRYGGRGVTVCDRWQSFRCFRADLTQVPGYPLWLDGEPLHLDKDTLVSGNRVYGPGLVQFVSKAENTRAAHEIPLAINGEPFRSFLSASKQFAVCSTTISNWYNKKTRENLLVASLLPWHPFLT